MLRKINTLLLIGVAHVLPRSLEEVRGKILEERPEVVAVELCPTRYAILVGGAGGRGPANPLAWLLNLVQDRFSSQTGMPAGKEMLTAVKSAMEVGAKIVLIDQSISTTLERLQALMPLREKFMLLIQMILALLLFRRKINVEALAEEEVVRCLVENFRNYFPIAARILIDERDEYMAMKLFSVLLSGRKTVCVVGAAHVLGIEKHLRESLREAEGKMWWREKIEFEGGN